MREEGASWPGVGKDYLSLRTCQVPELGYGVFAGSWHVAEKIQVSAEPQ